MFPLGRCVMIAAISIVTTSACSDSSGPTGLQVAGTWNGVSTLPNPFSTVFNLEQTGSTVSGTVRVAGSLPGAGSPLTGQVSSSARTFTWATTNGCELWGGVLTVTEDGEEMSGPVLIDRSGCVPAQSSGSGTMNVTRQ